MSEYLATTIKIYEAFGKGDIPAILDSFADDIRWEEWVDNSSQHAGVPWMVARTGKQGAMGFFQVVAGLQVTDLRILGFMAGGQQVAVEVEIEVHVPSSGKKYRDEEIHLWTFNDAGKVIRLRHYTDTAKHIAAAIG